jgi:hypothetical protein
MKIICSCLIIVKYRVLLTSIPFPDHLEISLFIWDSFLRNHDEINLGPIQTVIQRQDVSATVNSITRTENVVVLNMSSSEVYVHSNALCVSMTVTF